MMKPKRKATNGNMVMNKNQQKMMDSYQKKMTTMLRISWMIRMKKRT